jgi:hypothetical protein
MTSPLDIASKALQGQGLAAPGSGRGSSTDLIAKLPVGTTTQTPDPTKPLPVPTTATPNVNAKSANVAQELLSDQQLASFEKNGISAEKIARLKAAKSAAEQAAILNESVQQDREKWLKIIALIAPVMLNNWKVDANQVAWWKEAVPAFSGVIS